MSNAPRLPLGPGLLLLAALALLACSSNHGGNGTLVGYPCGSSLDCGPGGVCVTSVKGGECSLECQVPGGPQECPQGTYCDRENVKTDLNPKSEMLLCFPACLADGDCVSPQKCKPVTGGPGKVCH